MITVCATIAKFWPTRLSTPLWRIWLISSAIDLMLIAALVSRP